MTEGTGFFYPASCFLGFHATATQRFLHGILGIAGQLLSFSILITNETGKGETKNDRQSNIKHNEKTSAKPGK